MGGYEPNPIPSPLYDVLKDQGAVFGEKFGWERPNWFAAPREQARDIYSFGRPNWFEAVGREHRAVRTAAGLFDQSSFAKFTLEGQGGGGGAQPDCRRRYRQAARRGDLHADAQ